MFENACSVQYRNVRPRRVLVSEISNFRRADKIVTRPSDYFVMATLRRNRYSDADYSLGYIAHLKSCLYSVTTEKCVMIMIMWVCTDIYQSRPYGLSSGI